VNIRVIASSLPSDLFEKLTASAQYALKGCEEREDIPASVPEWWPERVGQRPQLTLNFVFPSNTGFNYSSLTIPYPVTTEKPSEGYNPLPSYQAGPVMGLCKLKDGSRLQCYAESESEARRVMAVLKTLSTRGGEQFVAQEGYALTGRLQPVRRKMLSFIDYFPEGRKTLKPLWRYRIGKGHPF
jgi:hypothetical protein